VTTQRPRVCGADPTVTHDEVVELSGRTVTLPGDPHVTSSPKIKLSKQFRLCAKTSPGKTLSTVAKDSLTNRYFGGFLCLQSVSIVMNIEHFIYSAQGFYQNACRFPF